MSSGWTEHDKKIVKTALERAQKRAEEDAVKRFLATRIASVKELWALELKIREWRKECGSGRFYFSYDSIEDLLGECLRRGWTMESDLASLSEARLEVIKKGIKPTRSAARKPLKKL